jgi:serine/threonine protein kinase
MGVVFKAIQRSFGREVALKRAAGDDPGLVEQFLSEARITGALEHANIVPVHHLRVPASGPPEMVMKLLKGTSWRDLLHPKTGVGLDREAHLRILLGVCNAVAYAHRRGVIHRDLKPENVMTDELGQIFVVDWGLAAGTVAERCAAEGTLFVGDVRQPAGTPGYMAPELASGDGAQQGVCTDVYLLGSCLHEVVTGRRRHEGATVREVLEQAVPAGSTGATSAGRSAPCSSSAASSAVRRCSRPATSSAPTSRGRS